MEYRPLGRTGLKVSALGFGASSLGGVFHPVQEADGLRTVRPALDGRGNYFDVSPYYGLTTAETRLGQARQGVPRGRYILATTCGRYGEKAFDFSARRVRAKVVKNKLAPPRRDAALTGRGHVRFPSPESPHRP